MVENKGRKEPLGSNSECVDLGSYMGFQRSGTRETSAMSLF